jgi:hypothetical protein
MHYLQHTSKTQCQQHNKKCSLLSGLPKVELTKFLPLIFYHLHSITLDIYEVKKVKISNYLIGTIDGLIDGLRPMQQSTKQIIK